MIKRVDTLLDQLATSEVATMVYVVADPGRGKLIVANAGHPPPIIIEPDGTVTEFSCAMPSWPVRSRTDSKQEL